MGHKIKKSDNYSQDGVELLIQTSTTDKHVKIQSGSEDGNVTLESGNVLGKISLVAGSGGIELSNSEVGIKFGADTNLYRSAADTLKTDDNLITGGNLSLGTPNQSARLNFAEGTSIADGIRFGMDTNLYRSTADTLATDDNFVSGKAITGNGLTPNFVPALFGIHWNATASTFVYNGGVNHDLLSSVTWTSPDKETVIQTIAYNGSDQPISIVTVGQILGRSATETLTWSGNDLTGYSISFFPITFS